MSLTLEQITEMAPDGGSAAAGKKLMALKNWEDLGHSAEALWGRCRGSAVYQVKVDLANLGYHCSCPSRKFPCKHVLGLLMLWAASPAAVAAAESPDWVGDWLERRRLREEKKAAAPSTAAAKPVDEKAQQRRTEQREGRVADGLSRLDMWLKDLVRNGLAGIEIRPPAFWDEQAKRLVDAQAPGLASRVARLAAIPRSSRDWPARLLAELGRLALLLHAWQRIEQLDPPLQSDVRQILGWTVPQADVERGEQIEDAWVVVGQWIDDEDRVRAQRSWLVGRNTNRTALVLQFAAGGQPFAEAIVPGSEQRATLAFYPGAVPQRAKFVARKESVQHVNARPPGVATIAGFLDAVTAAIACQPWLSAFGAVLHDVTLVPQEDRWLACDRDGRALPLWGRDHWSMLALSGGRPFDLSGEWDGYAFRPLGLYLDNAFRVV